MQLCIGFESKKYGRQNVLSLMLKGTHVAFGRKWQNSFGGRFRRSTGYLEQNKFSLFLGSTYKFPKYASVGLNLEENIFRSQADAAINYSELVVRMKVIFSW